MSRKKDDDESDADVDGDDCDDEELPEIDD